MHSDSYELVPTTLRTADTISQKHGFENVAKLAASLPENANVIDVGSGASPFGKTVAELRPDVTWTNFDYSYNDPDILQEAGNGAPENISFLAGDATKLSDVFDTESFDAVFSYWMIPHLSLYETEPAKEAAKAMFVLAKNGAPISIGPAIENGHGPAIRSRKALRVTKNSSTMNQDSFAEMIVDKTRLPRFARFTQRTANEVVTPLLGTSRWAVRDDDGKPKIFSRQNEEYVSPFSRTGLRTVGEIVLNGSRHVAEQHKPKLRKTAIIAGALAASVTARRYVINKQKE